MPEMPPLPPVSTQPLSLVLLAYNAAEHLQSVLWRWCDVLQERGQDFEIVLVDAGSIDATAQRAGELVARRLPLRVLQSDRPGLLGSALRIGLEAVRLPLVATSVCSPDYDPSDLKRLLSEIDRLHLLTGFRAGRRMPLLLRLLRGTWRLFARVLFSYTAPCSPGWLGWRLWWSGRLARMFFGVRIRDVYCPFRLFRREILQRIPIQSRSEFALVEFLAKANFAGCLMGEEVGLAVHPEIEAFPRQLRGVRFRDAYRLFTSPRFGSAMPLAVDALGSQGAVS